MNRGPSRMPRGFTNAPPAKTTSNNLDGSYRALRVFLFRTGDPDRAAALTHVAGIGHVQAGGAEQQQNSGGDDGEQDAIHRPHTDLKAGVRDPGRWVSGGKPGSLQQRAGCRAAPTKPTAETVGIVPKASA